MNVKFCRLRIIFSQVGIFLAKPVIYSGTCQSGSDRNYAALIFVVLPKSLLTNNCKAPPIFFILLAKVGVQEKKGQKKRAK